MKAELDCLFGHVMACFDSVFANVKEVIKNNEAEVANYLIKCIG